MRYDNEFRQQALQLSDEIGVKAAAERLGLKYYTLAEWRKTRTRGRDEAMLSSRQRAAPISESERRIRELEQELRETKRANEILQEALGFFAASRKK